MKRGTIEPQKLFKLYKGLYEQRSSGWLHLNHRSGPRKLYLERGCPALALSTVTAERLLPRLIREGVCSTSEAAQIEKRAFDGADSVEQTLINSDMISISRLEQVLVDLTSEAVWRSLAWRDGEFGWLEDQERPNFSVAVDVITLLGLGGQLVLTTEERTALWAKTHRMRAKFSRLNPEEEAAVRDLIGGEDAQQLFRGALLSRLKLSQHVDHQTDATNETELRQAALCGLIMSGFLKLSAPPTSASAPAPSTSSSHHVSSATPQAESGPRSLIPPPPPPVKPMTAASSAQASSPNQVQPIRPKSFDRLRTSSAQEVVPPAGFIDERARVHRSSNSSSSSLKPTPNSSSRNQASTSSRSIQTQQSSTRETPRDRRIIKPPENWRRFSIGASASNKKPVEAAESDTSPLPSSPSSAMTPPPPPSAMTPPPPPSAMTPPPPPSAMTPPPPPSAMAPPPPPSAMTPPPPPSAPSSMPSASSPHRPPPAAQSPSNTQGQGIRDAKRQKKPAPAKIQARVERFMERYQQRDELTHYELLGVAHNVEGEELKRSFKKLVGELHIDQYLRFDFDEATLEKLKQLFISVNRAHQVLSDPAQRHEYDLEQELVGGGDAAPLQKRDLTQLLHAEQCTREAIGFLKNGKIDLAAEKVQAALEINADDPLSESVSIYIDGLRAKSSNASVAVLRQHIDRLEALVTSYESREEPFLYLGVLYGYCQEYKRAISSLERALKINPHFAEANSQLRHLQRSQQSNTKKGGLFRRR